MVIQPLIVVNSDIILGAKVSGKRQVIADSFADDINSFELIDDNDHLIVVGKKMQFKQNLLEFDDII